MSDLGRRRFNPNDAYLNNIIQTGINQKILPDTFRSLISNNTRDDLWQKAYDDAVENGFVFAKYGEPDTDFFKMYWSQTQKQIMNSHTAIWRTKPYQDFEGRSKITLNIVRKNVPSLVPTFSKLFMYMLRNKVGINDEIQQVIMQTTGLSGVALAGGQIAKENTWIKPAATVAVIGTVIGVGVWKKDEIVDFFSGKKSKSVNGLDGLNGKKKGRKGKKGKGLGNAGMDKIKAIQKRAKKLQHESGYTMKNVTEVEVKKVRKSVPKLSWKDAQKRAANDLR